MKITVAELVEALQDMAPEAEVRIATQPSYPLEYGVAGWPTENDDASVVYIGEGASHGYLSRRDAENVWG